MDAAIGKIVTIIARLAKQTFKEPEKVLSVPAKIIITILLVLAIIGNAAGSLIGCFQGVDLKEENINPAEAYIYQAVEKFYSAYMEKMQEQMNKRKEELQKAYTETIEEVVPVYVEGYEKEVEVLKERIVMEYVPGEIVNGMPTVGVMVPRVETYYETETQWVEGYWTEETVTKEVCTARINTQLSPVNLAYILAYLTVTEEDILAQKKYTLNTGKVQRYMDYITPVKEWTKDISEEERAAATGDERYMKSEILIYNDILSVYDIADHYFAENSTTYEMFQLSFDMYLSFLDYAGLYANVEPGEIHVLYHEEGMNIPHYFQTDYTNVAYGNGTIASSGCALVCIAMAASYLNDAEYTPLDVLKFTGNQYYVSGAGSSWSIFDATAKHYGLICTDLGKRKNQVVEALQSGKPVIASMGKGTFTNSGHFIVIRGITADECFLVNDPNMSNYRKYGMDRFKQSEVFKEAKNFWCLE